MRNVLFLLLLFQPLSFFGQLNVSFSFNPNNACSGTVIQFTSTVSGGTSPYLYSWTFGDGGTSTLENPNHSFDALGCGSQNFTVVLTVTDTTNGGNITGSHTKTVTVNKRPNPELSDMLNDPDFSNCDNNPSPSNPNFEVSVQNETLDPGCITNYTIDWGDGNISTGLTNSSFPYPHLYTQLGAFNLTITAYGSNGCTGSTTYIVKNQSNPAIGISSAGNTQSCAPQTYSFTMLNYGLNSPGTIYIWDFGDGTGVTWNQDSVNLHQGVISHVYTTSSCGVNSNNEFIVSITASNSCSSTTATVSGIKIWTKPTADFDVSPEIGCVNQQFCFTNTTIAGYWGTACSQSTNYSWNFGNGQTSIAQNPPCQTYSSPGTYTIALEASNNCGTSTISKQIQVITPPDANASPSTTSGCVPFNVNFSNTSTGYAVQYTWTVSPSSGWSFVNSTNNHSQNPVIQFTNPGTYTVTLNVTNACGTDTQTFTITAMDVPYIALPAISGDCLPYTYVGNASYTNNGSNITTYNWSVTPSSGWNFVAPSTSGSQNPTILFSVAGFYQITVQASNGCGTGNQVSNQFEVFQFVQVNAGNDTSVCHNSGSFQLTGIPSGGTWSGNYVTSSGVFSPTVVGAYALTYSKGSGNCLSQDQVVVTVVALPSVNAGSNQSICYDNGPLTLTGSPSGGTWTGTGITNPSQGIFDPQVSGTGTFTLTYTYLDNQTGCSNADNVQITVYALPNVVGVDATLCNQPIPEQLNASPSGGTWSGPNVTATGVFTPAGTGIFDLLYSYTDNHGCSNYDSVFVTVIDPDTSIYAGTDTLVCLNSGSFQLVGSPPGGTWSGSYVTPSGTFSPTMVGDYTLTYSLGAGTCLTQDEKVVTVSHIPEVNAGEDNSICIDYGILTLVGDPSGGSWSGTGIVNPAQGTFDPTVSGTGSFTLTYTYADGQTNCSNSDDLVVTVYPLPSVTGEDTTLCNQPVPEQLIAYPSGGTWFGPNVSSTGIFTPNGTGIFALIYSYTDIHGCSNHDSVAVTVIDPDTTVNAGPDTSICAYESVYLDGTPPGGTWSGQYITPGGYFNPSTAGNYTLTYSIGVGSCLTFDTTTINVRPAPEAAFTFNTVCFGETTNFTDQSAGGGPEIISWFWKFGDSNTSQLQNPINTYLAPGSYYVTLLVTSENGCIDSIVQSIQVMPLPTVSFDVQMPACINNPISFFNSCSNAQTFFWDFGDGGTSTEFEPTHSYVNEGTYQVVLTATSGFGCVEADSMEIYITGPPPLPHFEVMPKEGCSPFTIYLSIDTNMYDDQSSYLWDFGNGNTSSELQPPDSITYQGSLYGDTVYFISFSSYNFCDYFTFTDSILVHPLPLSAFEMVHDWDCTPVDVLFKNFTKGLPESFYWDFGDGNFADEFEPQHTFTTGSSSTLYTIKLISYNDCGTDTISQDLLVKPNTVDAFFSVDKFMGCERDTFYFTNFSTDTSSVGISNISWNFGDGEGSSAADPFHVYEQEGTYIVRLHVDNGCGHDEMYDTITINPSPQIEIFSNNEACAGETLYFEFSSDVEIAGKTWYFGDGDTSNLSNPYHTFLEEGIYDVVLTGLAAHGFPVCEGIGVKQVVIKPTPDAYILPDTAGCAPLVVTFQGDSGSYHLWNFGENELYTSNPNHVFETPGLYKVKLISENSNTCRDMDSIEIRVLPSPESKFTFTSSGGYPELITFENLSTGATECFWDFGNGWTSNSCDITDPVEYNNNGEYKITLVTLNQYGCYDTMAVVYPVAFKGLFVPNAFAPDHPDPGINLFLPKGIGLLDYVLQVFDTWGNLLWESTELQEGIPAEGWDGTNEGGEPYPQDVYVWKIIAKFYDGTYWTNADGKNYGTVTLIR